jgi:ribonucleoside-diphosphate reductase alpha chain
MAGIKLTDAAEEILEDRYYLKNKDGGIIEDWERLCQRVAKAISSKEKKESRESIRKHYFDAIYNRELVASTPTLMNAGTELGQLSACFVLPVEDSLESIFDTVKHAAIIHKSGGGTGMPFSLLRSKDSKVGSTQGVASGAISFIRPFNEATEVVKQGSKRRGANMGMLHVTHPEIIDFIKAKDDVTKLTNFNLSVGYTDEFMDKVLSKDPEATYNLVDPHSKEKFKQKVKEVFDLAINRAWVIGDPGVAFIDKANANNPVPHLGIYFCTNPCGELWLLFYESCNLGAVNLAKMVKDGKIDWDKLKYTVTLGTRFLDSVIDNNKFPMPQIKEMTEKIRRIGMGITGLHDLLIQLEIPYDTQEARDIASKIMLCVESTSVRASEILGKEKGIFPAYDEEYCKFSPRRNAQTTTIQPSGTMSMFMDCSSGCEPYFYPAYYKHVLDDSKLLMVNKHFEIVARREGFYSKSLLDDVAESGTVVGDNRIPEKWQKIFKCAHDIHWSDHVKMQAVLQNNGVHGSISKTINMKKDATEQDIRESIIMAYNLDCKGITVYRDGCRKGQPVQLTKEDTAGYVSVKRVLPDELPAKRYKIKCGDEKNRYIIISFDEEEKPIEIFASDKRTNDLESASMQTLVFRLISTAFRYGIPIEEIIKQLERSANTMFDLPNQLANIMKQFASKTERGYKVKCPECGQSSFIFQEGCSKCLSCGHSKCGG